MILCLNFFFLNMDLYDWWKSIEALQPHWIAVEINERHTSCSAQCLTHSEGLEKITNYPCIHCKTRSNTFTLSLQKFLSHFCVAPTPEY